MFNVFLMIWCSIGSLGKESHEAGVQNVTVKTTTFTGTQNGLRIKSWGRPSNGFARDIIFQHAVMNNVQNPILIDQNYCPGDKNCPGQVRQIYTLPIPFFSFWMIISKTYLNSCCIFFDVNRILVWKLVVWATKTFMDHQQQKWRWNSIVAKNIDALGSNYKM